MDIRNILEGLKQYINSRNASVFKPVDTLPTASENTLNFIFLVPNSTENGRDEYVTIDNGEEANPRYTWDSIGSTTIDLSGYVTAEGLNSLLDQLSEYITVSVNCTATQAKFINAKGEETVMILDSANSNSAGLLSAGTFNDITDLKSDVAALKEFKGQQEETNGDLQEAINDIPASVKDCATQEAVDSLALRIHTKVVGGDSDVQIKNLANTDTLTIPSASSNQAGVMSKGDYAKFAGMEDAVNMAAATANTALNNASTALGQALTIKSYVPTDTNNNNKLVNEARLAQIPSAEAAVNIANQALNAVGKLAFTIVNGSSVNLTENHCIVAATGSGDFEFILPNTAAEGKFYILKDCRSSGSVTIKTQSSNYMYVYSKDTEYAITKTRGLGYDGCLVVYSAGAWRFILCIPNKGV